jgi:hypothetical protein
VSHFAPGALRVLKALSAAAADAVSARCRRPACHAVRFRTNGKAHPDLRPGETAPPPAAEPFRATPDAAAAG